MNRRYCRVLVWLTIVALTIVALTLGACGRKGKLFLPGVEPKAEPEIVQLKPGPNSPKKADKVQPALE